MQRFLKKHISIYKILILNIKYKDIVEETY